MIKPNKYEEERKRAEQRNFQLLDMKQRYVRQQQQRAEAERLAQMKAERAYEKEQNAGAAGNREMDWAGKGLAAGGLWGALAGATGARTVNAVEAGSHGSLGHRLKGIGEAFFSPRQLVAGLKTKTGSQSADKLAGGMGQEFSRNQQASKNAAWSDAEKDRIAMSDQQGRNNLALQKMAGQQQGDGVGESQFALNDSVTPEHEYDAATGQQIDPLTGKPKQRI